MIYQTPSGPTVVLHDDQQQVIFASVAKLRSDLGSRYCHGGYVQQWNIADEI